MKALVTGGAGFIGSHLCEELLDQNHSVICLDNLSVGTKDNLKSFSNNENFKLVVGDVRDRNLIEKMVEKIDIIFHLAAVVGVSVVVHNPTENISVNSEGTKNIVEMAYKLGKKKVVFASSSEVYGKNAKVPLSEEKSLSIFGPTTVTRWAYGLAKSLSEHTLFGFAEKGLPIAIVRYFNCYGPRGINKSYSNVIPGFVKAALTGKPLTIHGDGKQTRSFCYITDSVNGTILAGEKLVNKAVNIGSDKEVQIIKLAKTIKKLCKSRSEIKFIPEHKIFEKKYEDSKRRVPDIKRAKEILGFAPKVKLISGLKKTISWTREYLKINQSFTK